MSTKLSLRERFKSYRSKRAVNPDEQNGRHPPDGPTTPPVIDTQGTPASPDTGAKKIQLSTTTLQETLKASSIVPVTDVPVTDAQPGPAGADLQAKEPLPATEFVVQQTQAISTSQRLWNDAYDSLENDSETAELVRAYVKTLTTILTAEKAPDTSKLKDPIQRQIYMKKLVEDGQAKVSAASKITNAVGDVAQFILSAKGMIDLAIQNIPQAALPWAGVCIGLQVSSRSFSYLVKVSANTCSRSS
jgi:hypothetical protein